MVKLALHVVKADLERDRAGQGAARAGMADNASYTFGLGGGFAGFNGVASLGGSTFTA